MRIALDLQACQTHSRRRGIGRYATALSSALLRARDGGDEFIVSLDGTYSREATEVELALQGLLPRSACPRYFYPHSQKQHGDSSCVLRPAADALVRSHYAGLGPDVLHINSMFEGLVEPAGGLGQLGSIPGVLTSLTLYDLIPAIFPQHYLADPNHKAWYQRRLASLQSFDVLLCISEATKRDAKELLGVPEHRLAVIHAGLDAIFKTADVDADVRKGLLPKLGIDRSFVLYTGNDDFRKNLRGAITAFARIPFEQRRGTQLVLNQVDDGPSLRRHAAAEGLAESDLVLTGRVSDEDLVLLYQTCKVFFFPSRYEGFGLPVLEAMACGAPTIAANNSSLPEIIGRNDALFDVDSTDEAARLLHRALSDEGYRRSLIESGQKRAAEFTWERSARLAREAWAERRKPKDVARKSMVSARLQRPRIAMVTPIPPDQTGIASYVEDLLPSLGYHFDIDLYTTCVEPNSVHGPLRVFAWEMLEKQASRYDHVVYQFGNSDFHSHMFALLGKVPGTVVLHDVFLSSILSYMDGVLGYPGMFELELDRSHGRGALALARGEGRLEAERRFPASYGVLQAAVAVMVHSEHARELCKFHYPGLSELPRKITMPQKLAVRPSLSTRNAARQALGIDPEEFLIISLGMLGATKLNHRIVEAMALNSRSARRKVRLVFVGKPDSAAYAEVVNAASRKLSSDITMQITGFVSDAEFELYLAAADCAVQLRTTSKGETSRALLDCLAHGVPTVVNDYASFREIGADVVSKVSAEATVEELAVAVHRLMDDDAERSRLGEAGWRHIAQHHDPVQTAQDYADVVHGAIAIQRAASDDLVTNLVGVFHEGHCAPSDLAAVEMALAQQRAASRPPQVFIDVSHIIGNDLGTGIQRVVRNVARELMLAERPSMMSYHAVALSNGQMMLADDFVADSWGVPKAHVPQAEWPIAADIFLMIDSIWDRTEAFAETIAKFHAQGARVGCFIYDLLPIRFPKHFVDYMPAMFDDWLRFAVKNCDFIVCISRAVADDLALWIDENDVDPGSLSIGHVHLGSDIREFEGGSEVDEVSAEMRQAMSGGRSLLMVGTVEPRKRHDLVLAAFERAWAAGSDLQLVIVGKKGWSVDSLCQKIKTHSQFGRRLFWFARANDADLQHAYANAQRLIQASDGEGFGLPIVEAARYGVPLLLSDIPVFREIAGDCAEYFPAGDANALLEHLTSGATLRKPDPAIAIGWAQTARQLESLLQRGSWDHVFGD